MEYIKIAIFFAAGIYLHNRIDPCFAVIFLLSLIMVLTVSAVFKHKFNLNILIFITALVCGVILCRLGMCADIRGLAEYEGHYVYVTGRVCELPQKSGDNTHYIVDVRKVSFGGEERKLSEKLQLTSPEEFKYGDTITFSGFVNPLTERMNEDGFDYKTYCNIRKIFFKTYSGNAMLSDDKINDYSPYALAMYAREFVSGVIDDNYSGDYAAVMKAVLTGNKNEFSEEYDKILERTGSKRFFNPAFLNVMIFMAAASFLLSALERSKRDIVTVFLLIIYGMMNASAAVYVKLCILISLMLLFKRFLGRVYYLDVLGITALIMGLINPTVFYDAGFVMSMLSSVMIYYFFDTVYGSLKAVRVRYIRRTLSIGIICSVGLIPISAYFFGGVNIYQTAASMIMIPCAALIIILSPLLILMLTLFHTAPVVGALTRIALFIISRVPVAMDKLYLSQVLLPKPSLLFLIIYALVTVAAVKYVKKKRRHAYMALLSASALTLSAFIGQAARLNDIDVTFVNVGQGDGAVITAPYRFNVLIDGGGGNNYSDYNPGETLYLDYLLTKGITEVDSAFVSHYHQDHVQGIIAAMENIRVKNLFMPDSMEGSEWRVKLENTAAEHNTKVHYISEETLITYENGMTILAIPPSKKTLISSEENDTTCVYRVEYGDFSCLFTGDMTAFAELNMIGSGKADSADVLKVAHHGSRTSTCPQWAEAVNPKYAVISVGENNEYALPNSETLEHLKNAEIYRTDYDGDIRMTAEKDGSVKIKTFDRIDGR